MFGALRPCRKPICRQATLLVLAHEHQLPSPVTVTLVQLTSNSQLQCPHVHSHIIRYLTLKNLGLIATIPRPYSLKPPHLFYTFFQPTQRTSRTHARDAPPARMPSTPAKTINLPKDSPRDLATKDACTIRRSIRLSLFAKPYPLHTPWRGTWRYKESGCGLFLQRSTSTVQFNSLSSRNFPRVREIRVLGLL